MKASETALIERAAKIASERAANALSELVGQPLTSQTQLGRATRAPANGAIETEFNVQGFEKSAFVAAFPPDALRTVGEMLAPGMPDSAESRDMVAREVSNICVSHFLNALGDLIHASLLPSPPEHAGPPPKAAAEEYVIHTDFLAASGGHVHGTLRFLPGPKLIEAVRRASEG